MVPIVQKEDSVLRKIAKEVPVGDIASSRIKKIIAKMKEALDSQDDGVAIAAPQVGASLRIFVISGKVFLFEDQENRDSKKEKSVKPDMVFINPEIIKISRKKYIVPEGCLSVRWLYGKTIRANKARIKAYDENGKAFTYGGSGLIAQIFQHETDHLNGILFIDHATDVKEMLPKEKNERGDKT